MTLLPQELIRRKRDGGRLTEAELEGFFYGFLRGAVADYQMGAMLMAVTLKGMDAVETAALTQLMRDSGERFAWPYPRHLIVDKHSTGGIGDKTSLLLLPLAILEGLKVPMMAGRGLGHTGGTLDKLEAVGWTVLLDPAAARAQVERLGGVIMGQTERVTPLDQRLYAMRDVTATVESPPLIVGSILSKKLAEGIGALVMDVKFGSGAFMSHLPDAQALALQLKRVGEECGLKVRCLLTSMDSPLGRYAGNALEVLECLEVMSGQGPEDTRALTVELAAEMVLLARPEEDPAALRTRLRRRLADGSARELFLRIAEAQGGDPRLLERPADLMRAPLKVPVMASGMGASGLASGPSAAKGQGFVSAIDTRKLGVAILELGGGRRLVTDKIDPWVGLAGMKRVGEPVAQGEPVAIVHARDDASAAAAAALVAQAYRVGDRPVVDPVGPHGVPASLIAARL
jgi:pyrimidine-nucleoside phosphorylase